MKLSKQAKARIKRMSMTEKAALKKACNLLADAEVITHDRYMAVMRACS